MFLLFQKSRNYTFSDSSDLHSNMFLLFRDCQLYAGSASNIYIPICFYYFGDDQDCDTDEDGDLHSNMFLLFRFRYIYVVYRCKIYIPICFYYFEQYPFYEKGAVCIYIPICFYYFYLLHSCRQFRTNLHSNMFLLFPRPM